MGDAIGGDETKTMPDNLNTQYVCAKDFGSSARFVCGDLLKWAPLHLTDAFLTRCPSASPSHVSVSQTESHTKYKKKVQNAKKGK